jgi:hypothetical protein
VEEEKKLRLMMDGVQCSAMEWNECRSWQQQYEVRKKTTLSRRRFEDPHWNSTGPIMFGKNDALFETS